MKIFIKNTLFTDYFKEWIDTYKKDAVKDTTLEKYNSALNNLKTIAPKLKVKDITHSEYQNIINKYAETHEKQTTLDFHNHLKACILDAIDDGLLKSNPTRRTVIKGKIPGKKKEKFLNLKELQKLLNDLDLGEKINNDYLILLIAKTGLRFSEAVALTPEDFDFKKNTLNINKSWDYKNTVSFTQTKNESSIRKIAIDKKTSKQFKELLKTNKVEPNKPIFIKDGCNIFNSTVNDQLVRHCKNAGITIISLHSLRHTHASILLYKGVSIASVSKRLGHSNIAITQKVYSHIIDELANKDSNIIIKSLSEL